MVIIIVYVIKNDYILYFINEFYFKDLEGII